jgi:hypothetical protein
LGTNSAFALGPRKTTENLDRVTVVFVTVVDPRRLTRPLSVNSTTHVETLSDLFTLSADRAFHRRVGSRDNM